MNAIKNLLIADNINILENTQRTLRYNESYEKGFFILCTLQDKKEWDCPKSIFHSVFRLLNTETTLDIAPIMLQTGCF